MNNILYILLLIFGVFIIESSTKPIRSDVIQTRIGPDPDDGPYTSTINKPGWMRRQLVRFGEVASKVGNTLGKHASIVTNAIEKVCEVVKTVIPLLSAVCHVGQFKFCAATEQAPDQLFNAMKPESLDLDVLDK